LFCQKAGRDSAAEQTNSDNANCAGFHFWGSFGKCT
jgi:hypothetical protein